MKKKLFISLSVFLVCGTAFIANYVSADESISSEDPNVVVLTTVKAGYPCYMDKDFNCNKSESNQGCAACDDDIIVTPEKPVTHPTDN